MARARLLLEQSLVELAKSIELVEARVRTPQSPEHALDVELLARMVKVRGIKTAATKISGAKTVERMRQLVSEALWAEQKIVDAARDRRRPL